MGEAIGPERVVAVVGCGTMGAGIAQVALTAGHRVLLHDASPTRTEEARAAVARGLGRLVAKGSMSGEGQGAALARLAIADGIGRLGAAGLVVEAIVEDLAAKQGLFRALEGIVDDEAVLATNTSSLSITALAAGLRHPGRVVGMHFFNPAPVMALVEIVSGLLTDPAVAGRAFATAALWGKTPVHLRSSPGFLVNRVARPFYGEALRLQAEGVADIPTIDALMREAGGYRMGPFELMDLIGLDVNLAVGRQVFEALDFDPRYRPALLQKELVAAGRLGRKSGRGFYDHGPQATRPEAACAKPAPAPTKLVVEGDAGPLAPLVAQAAAAGIGIVQRPGPGRLALGPLLLLPSEGATASETANREGRPVALVDLASDLATAPRLALAFADQAGPEEKAAAIGLLQAAGKRVSVVDDAPGLVVLRLVAMMANEAADLARSGVAAPDAIDRAMRLGANHPIGPLAWAEAIGLDRVVAVIDALARIQGEDRYRVAPLLRRRALGGGRLLDG